MVGKSQCVKSNKSSVSFTRATRFLLAYGVSISSLSQFDQLITLDHFNSPAPVPPTLNPLKVELIQSHFEGRWFAGVGVTPMYMITHERVLNMYG